MFWEDFKDKVPAFNFPSILVKIIDYDEDSSNFGMFPDFKILVMASRIMTLGVILVMLDTSRGEKLCLCWVPVTSRRRETFEVSSLVTPCWSMREQHWIVTANKTDCQQTNNDSDLDDDTIASWPRLPSARLLHFPSVAHNRQSRSQLNFLLLSKTAS